MKNQIKGSPLIYFMAHKTTQINIFSIFNKLYNSVKVAESKRDEKGS